ncbi:MASE3 domain-containing sensor histidine kinase [Inediibacterium massiliense]|uniref:MASE3 domain-containing sensor histidine kinase n=1 Tax=Inediibacterium massiliense TaxID=1658111 RepID=UPI0006B572FF|nr:ABC transporter substrate binding protein [Inediibacterium massiliense]
MISKKIVSIIFCAFFAFILLLDFTYANQVPPKNVLLLHSDYRGYEWTDQVENGIKSFFIKNKSNIELSIEYMDIKRHPCKMFVHRLSEFYKSKYKHMKFDAIIATDIEAFHFLQDYKDELFINTPIVCCGGYDEKILKDNGCVGVIEKINIKKSIDTVLKIHPNTKNIVFITDQTDRGKDYKEKIINTMTQCQNMNIQIWDDTEISRVVQNVKGLPKESIIFFMYPILRNEVGNVMPIDAIYRMVENSNIPIYSFWDVFLNHGIMGGLLIEGVDEGVDTAKLVDEIINGKDTNDIQNIKITENQWTFDYNEMQKFNIDSNDVPKGSQVANEPTYSIDKDLFHYILMYIFMILIFFIGILVINIQKRKKIEKQLKDHINFMDMLIDTIPNPIFYRNKEGVYLGCNKSFEQLMGLTKEEIIGYRTYDLFYKDIANIYCHMDEELIHKGGVQIYESKIHNKEKDYKYVIFHKAVYTNLEGEGEGLIGVISDITERKNMELELKESEERYSQLVELLPDGLAICDDSKIEFVNTASVKLFGANSKDELIGKNIHDFIYKDYYDTVQNRIQKVVLHKNNVPLLEQKAVRLNGEVIDVEGKLIPFCINRKTKYVSIIRDITERKNAEALKRRIQEAEEQDKIKTEFFANLSHELRTPLNLIFSSIQLLELDFKNKDIWTNEKIVNKRMKVLKQNGYRLLRLVNNLIDITKIDSGYFELDIQNYNIVSIVEEITLSVVEYMKEKKIHLQFDTDIEEKIIACDPDNLERILLNLFSNAVKFTNPGGHVYVNVWDQKDGILIEVKDTGVGIPKDQLELIFERFKQVDKSLRRNHEGSGIGLSLVESLVKMQGGSIWVNSEVGKGTTFMIKFLDHRVDVKKDESLRNNTAQPYTERIHIEFSDIYVS